MRGLRPGTTVRICAVLAARSPGRWPRCGGDPGRLDTVGDSVPSPPAAPRPRRARPAAPPTCCGRRARRFSSRPSVHVTGTAVRGSDAFVVDARLRGSAGGTATVATSGETVDVVRIGDVAYVSGDLAFWRSVTADETRAEALAGSCVRTGSPGAPVRLVRRLHPALDLRRRAPGPGGPATLGAGTVIRGTPVITVRDGSGSTLSVAGTGPAYPLRIDGLTAGQVVFLDFADTALLSRCRRRPRGRSTTRGRGPDVRRGRVIVPGWHVCVRSVPRPSPASRG